MRGRGEESQFLHECTFLQHLSHNLSLAKKTEQPTLVA